MKERVIAVGAVAVALLSVNACDDSGTAGSTSASSSGGSSSTSSGSSSASSTSSSGVMPMAGIVVGAPATTTTNEAGGTVTFTVKLSSAPTADVTIGLSVDNAMEAQLDKTSLTFTSANYDTAQTVTVTGRNDDVADGDVAYNVVFAPATSGDSNYTGKTAANIALTNADDDMAGLLVGAPSAMRTTEKATTVTFTVRLRSRPTANVTVPVASSRTGEATVMPAMLTFTPMNYDMTQTVTVTGVNDDAPDGDQMYNVNLGATTSTDTKYVGTSAMVALTNVDDDAIVNVASIWTSYCAQFVDGRLKCWGRNESGALGLGDTVHRGSQPGHMGNQLPFVNLGTGRTVKALAAGNRPERYTCAILDNDTLKCWGLNGNGQLGLGDTNNRGDGPGEMGDALPAINLGTMRTPKRVAVGAYHACAILDNDTLKCWGYNNEGMLGYGDTLQRGDQGGEMGDALPTVNLGAGRTAKAVSLGNNHTCALLDNDTVKCWGDNNDGRLGYGDTIRRGDTGNEMGDFLPAVSLGAMRTVRAVQASHIGTCALLDNATVKCWGNGSAGMTGLGDTNNRGDQPNEMGDTLPALTFGAGRTVTRMHVGHSESCVTLDNGSVKCWGANDFGQVGAGDTNHRGDQPNEMGDMLPVLNLGAGRTITDVYAGTYSHCAKLDNGALKCWGFNDNGWGSLGLGDNNRRGDQPNEMGDMLPAVKLIGP